MVIGVVIAEPEASPLQWSKVQPSAALAVNWTSAPRRYVAWFGFLVTVPLPTGSMIIVNGYSGVGVGDGDGLGHGEG